MFRKSSIYFKFTLGFIITVLFVLLGGYVALVKVEEYSMRNMAESISSQVVAFRSWVALSGVVYVDKLHRNYGDFLGEKACEGNGSFYSKNPALATRELSKIANQENKLVTFRVTSDNYRNLDNTPDEFETKAIQELKSKPESYVEYKDKVQYRYAKALLVEKSCLKCHSTPENAPADVIKKYGDKRGFGYKEGEIRGIISVTVARIPFTDLAKHLFNVYTIGLLVLGLLFNFMMVRYFIVGRIKKLTAISVEISKGNMNVELETEYKDNSKDEIDMLGRSMNLMKKSIEIVINKFSGKN